MNLPEFIQRLEQVPAANFNITDYLFFPDHDTNRVDKLYEDLQKDHPDTIQRFHTCGNTACIAGWFSIFNSDINLLTCNRVPDNTLNIPPKVWQLLTRGNSAYLCLKWREVWPHELHNSLNLIHWHDITLHNALVALKWIESNPQNDMTLLEYSRRLIAATSNKDYDTLCNICWNEFGYVM